LSAAAESQPELTWLAGVLWNGAGLASASGRYAVLPSMSRPRLLLPVGSPRASAAALATHNTSRGASRVGARLLAAGFRFGISEHLLRARVGPPANRRGEGEVIEDHVQEVLGREVLTSIFFQTGRPQKKPVLQLFTPAGAVAGYAKVGWNDVTRRLVVREADALEHVLQQLRTTPVFGVAEVLYRGRWQGRELVIVAALPGLSTRLIDQLPIEATNMVPQLGEPRRCRLVNSEYWSGQNERLRRFGTGITRRLAAAAELALEPDEIMVGFCHGDWVPWNMARDAGGRLVVWDWEWSLPSAPVGLDALQWLFQVALNLKHVGPPGAVDQALAAANQALPRLGVRAEAARPLLALHLIEAILRLEEGRAGGVGHVISTDRYDRAATALLEGMP
jgi:hypothetical protein